MSVFLLIFIVGTQIQSKRLAHTDIQIPNFDAYRKDFLKDPTVKTNHHISEKQNFAYLVAAGNVEIAEE